mgnify:CR=1 FL=1
MSPRRRLCCRRARLSKTPGRGPGVGIVVAFHPMAAPLPSKFKVGLVQMSMSPDPAANVTKAVARIQEAAKQGASLVCLPELFRTQ